MFEVFSLISIVPFAGFYDDIIAFDGVYETILFVDASAEIAAEVLQHFRLANSVQDAVAVDALQQLIDFFQRTLVLRLPIEILCKCGFCEGDITHVPWP